MTASNPYPANLGEQAIIDYLTGWAAADPRIRAVIWTSTRTNPEAAVDALSDYDIILVVAALDPFLDDGWLGDFGDVLVLYRDPVRQEAGGPQFTRVTQYESGLKIDFTVMPAARWQRWTASPDLPADLDVGYRVLLDKDGLAAGLPAPTYTAYIPNPPDEAAYRERIETFFHEATYVGKNLWRDELLAARYSADHMTHAMMRPMLEWRMEIDRDWSLKTGAAGKGLKKQLPPDIWAAFEATLTGADIDDNWNALFAACALYRRLAVEVGTALGYAYPEAMDRRTIAYLKELRALPPTAERFER